MYRILKTFLFWLLITVLPVQETAAVIQSSCAARHQPMSAATPLRSAAAPVLAMHAHNGASARASDQHHPAVSSSVAQTAVHKHTGHKHSSCSACAACCFGAAAPPPAVDWSPVPARSESVRIPPPVLRVGYVPASPERPPRFSA